MKTIHISSLALTFFKYYHLFYIILLRQREYYIIRWEYRLGSCICEIYRRVIEKSTCGLHVFCESPPATYFSWVAMVTQRVIQWLPCSVIQCEITKEWRSLAACITQYNIVHFLVLLPSIVYIPNIITIFYAALLNWSIRQNNFNIKSSSIIGKCIQ